MLITNTSLDFKNFIFRHTGFFYNYFFLFPCTILWLPKLAFQSDGNSKWMLPSHPQFNKYSYYILVDHWHHLKSWFYLICGVKYGNGCSNSLCRGVFLSWNWMKGCYGCLLPTTDTSSVTSDCSSSTHDRQLLLLFLLYLFGLVSHGENRIWRLHFQVFGRLLLTSAWAIAFVVTKTMSSFIYRPESLRFEVYL